MAHNLLIVDDNQRNLQALEAQLEDLDCTIHSAQDAETALSLITEHPFCLAIIDVQMSPTSGFELARLILGVKKFQNLPIIFLTASSPTKKFSLEGYSAGCVDLLYKPVLTEVIRAKVQIFLQLEQQREEFKMRFSKEAELREKAEVMGKSASLLLANVSHEMRTPLNSIAGFSELLTMSEKLDEQERYLAEKVRKSAKELTTIVDDVLNMSRMNAGMVHIEKASFNLRETIREIEEVSLRLAQKKSVRFSMDIQGSLPPEIVSDATRVKQVANNLINNAVKFTEAGEVQLHVSVVENTLVFEVRDSGIGISPAQQSVIFKPFKQANRSVIKRFGGSGLGLALSKDLCKALGGDLELVSSVVGEGSVFRATFCVDIHTSAQDADESQSSGTTKASAPLSFANADLKALCVDDILNNLIAAEALLSHVGIKTTTCLTGEDALRKAVRAHYDFVLLDLQMPEMDGFEVFTALREKGFTNPIYALTGHVTDDIRQKCQDLGFDDFLTKPFSLDQLKAALSESEIGVNAS